MSEATNTTGATSGEAVQETAEKPMESQKTYDETYVRTLREEASAARVAKRYAADAARTEVKNEYEAKLADKDTAYAELEGKLAAAQLELKKVWAALDAKVPSEKVRQFASILQGTDEDSIADSAKSALDLFGDFDKKSPAFDPTQGTGGSKTPPLNGDPILAALIKAVG